MALGHFQSHALNGYAPVSGATVTVTNELTGGLATLKSDYAGATPKSNGAGFVTDLDGYFDFFTSGGFYKIVVEKDGASKTWRYVPIGTLQGYDIEALLNFKRVTVRAATTANITISTALNNGDSLDGLTLATDDLVLVKDQTTKSQNGIYKTAASPARATGYDAWNDYVGLLVAVSSGTANANTLWIGTNNAGGVLGTNDIVFTKLTVAGGNAPIDSPAFTGSFALTGDISPTSLSADQDDYNPTGLSGAVVIRQATGAFYSINGLQGGSDGRVILIKNAGSNPLQIGAERASSTAAYRFAMSADLLLGPGETAMFEYDSTSSRWVLVGRKPRPEHLEVTPDPFPTVPHKPTVFADWSTMPWLDRYLTFTRASIASYTDRKGILRYAPAGVPRFHTIYSSGETGLLIEGSRTNLLTRSQEFNHADWTKTQTTISADATTAPDGSSTADKIQESNATNAHLIEHGFSGTSGTTYTGSVFLKAAERGFALVAFTDIFAGLTSVQVNLTTGAVTTGAGTPLNAFTETLPNGWFRVGFSLAATSTGTGRILVYVSTDGIWANRSYTGSTGSGIYGWGAQLEAGDFASSYIPTTSGTVTRSADSCYRTISDVANADEFAFYLKGIEIYPSSGARIVGAIGNNAATFGADLYWSQTGSVIAVNPNIAPVNGLVSITGNASSANKMVAAMAANNLRAACNGTLGTPDTSCTLPASIDRFTIGVTPWGSAASFCGLIQEAAYWPTSQLSNANLQAITT